LEKNVLGDILGILGVAEQARAQADDSALKAIDEDLECAEVFGRDTPQQLLIFHRFRDLDYGPPLDQA
jgi:hypothetical protein